MGGKMKALVKHHGGPGAELQTVDIPTYKDDEVLIQVKAATICGTDLHIYLWDEWAASRIQPPMVFGHEFSGVVVEKGKNVTSVEVGDHVSAETHIVCNECPQCMTGKHHICRRTEILGVDRPGCFAEYVVMPAQNLWKNDPELRFEIASIQEPMGNAVHTVLSGSIAGKSCAVVGCGPIGLMAIAVAKATGASQIIAIDVNPYRLQMAKDLGATHSIHSGETDPVQQVIRLTGGNGAEVVLEMSGHPLAIQQAFRMISNGGRMSMLGLPTKPVDIDITNDIVFKGITIHGITGRLMFETWRQTAGLLHSGQVDLLPLITHRLPLEKFEEGFELMKSGQSGKVVLIP